MEDNFTSYLRLRKTPIKLENDESTEEDLPNTIWSPDNINLLLKLRFDDERRSKFEKVPNRTFQRKDLWDEIASEMYRVNGIQISGDVCDLKYRNMLQTYKKNRNKELNGMDPKDIAWGYYEIFKNALKNTEEKEASQQNLTNTTDEQAEQETATSNSTNKRKKFTSKYEMNPFTPIVELRQPSARLSNKRLLSGLSQSLKMEHSTPIAKPMSKMKLNEHDNQSMDTNYNFKLTNFELEECRMFGETVGIQLSLIKTPEIRALAELKIQEVLYAAKLSKLKE